MLRQLEDPRLASAELQYNASTVRPGFSPLDAVRTTLILWPHQFPAGLLKNPVFADHQRALSTRLEADAAFPFKTGVRTFRFVHFSIPHVPFVFDRDGYHPPFDPIVDREDLYEHQLEYVDLVFGRLMSGLEQQRLTAVTTVVVMSDHEYRALMPRGDWPHVPLIVGRPAGGSAIAVGALVKAEDVLRTLVRTGTVPVNAAAAE